MAYSYSQDNFCWIRKAALPVELENTAASCRCFFFTPQTPHYQKENLARGYVTVYHKFPKICPEHNVFAVRQTLWSQYFVTKQGMNQIYPLPWRLCQRIYMQMENLVKLLLSPCWTKAYRNICQVKFLGAILQTWLQWILMLTYMNNERDLQWVMFEL